MDTTSAALLLFLVMDPLGNIPLLLAALKSVKPERQLRVVVRELLIAYVVLVVFLFAGRPLLGWLHISEASLLLAGGVVLFLIALRMVFPSPEHATQEDVEGEPFIVPLAIPYIAGPSALATVILFMSSDPARWPEWWLALTLAWVACAIILLLSSTLRYYLGRRGLIAIERLMGLVLVAVAIEMFLRGVGKAFPGAVGGQG